MPKDRGAEHGDVDGPLERSFALGVVAAETRRRVAVVQAAGSLPWIGVDDASETQRLQAEHAAKLQRVYNFQLGGPENSQELTTHVKLCEKMEAWRSCGAWMVVTSCVTPSWCRPT